MKKKNEKKVLPREDYQSPYESDVYKKKKLYKEEDSHAPKKRVEITPPPTGQIPEEPPSPYEEYRERIREQYQENPQQNLEEIFEKDSEEETKSSTPQEKKPYHPPSDPSDQYESPYASHQEQMERTFRVKGTPSYNPCVEKELSKIKRGDLPRKKYQSPYESETYKNNKLYKEDSQEDSQEDAQENGEERNETGDSPQDSNPSPPDTSHLYQSPFEAFPKEKRVFDKDYNSYDLPFIETRVTGEIRGSRVMDFAYENANMEHDEQVRFEKHFKFYVFLLVTGFLLALSIAVLNLPPRIRLYEGDLGTYKIFHYQNIILTPANETITYQRSMYQKALYYSFFMPNGEEVRTSSLKEGYQLHTGKLTALTAQEKELYGALVVIEENYRTADDSYHSTLVYFLIQAYHVPLGVFFVLKPYLLVDFAVFCYPAKSPQYYTAEFHKKCRNVALAFTLFSLSPLGGRLYLNLVMGTMGRLVGTWAGIVFSAGS